MDEPLPGTNSLLMKRPVGWDQDWPLGAVSLTNSAMMCDSG